MENDTIVSIFELAEKAFREGEFEKAKNWYELADQQSRRMGVYQIRIKSLNKLGWLYTVYGDERNASDSLGNARQLGCVVFGANHPLYAATLTELGQLSVRQKNYDEAEALFVLALSVFDTIEEKDWKTIAKIYSGMAMLHALKQDAEGADRYLNMSLSLLKQVEFLPAEIAAIHASAGYAQACLEKFKEAEKSLKQAIGVVDQSFSPAHILNRYYLVLLAGILQQQSKNYDAEICLRRAISIGESTFGERSPQIFDDIMSLIELRCAEQQLDQTDTLVRRAIAISEQHSNADAHSKLKQRASILYTKALLHASSGDARRAESLLRNAMLLHELFFESMDQQTFVIIDKLAELVTSQGKHSEAEALYRKLIFLWQHVRGPVYPGITFNYTKLAEALAAQGKFEESQQYYDKAVELCNRIFGNEHYNTASCLESYTKMLKKKGDRQRAHQVEALAQTTWCKIGRHFTFDIEGSIPT